MAEDIAVDPPGDVDLTDELDLDDLDLVDDVDDGPAPVVDVAQVRRFLSGIGATLSFAIGDPTVPEHWRFTDTELDELAPALTALANRRPELARAIERSDHLVVAATMARYVGRNVQLGRRARLERKDHDDAEHAEAGGVGGWGLAARPADPAR